MITNSVTIRQLRAFAAVARHGSFVQAADTVRLSQPALSHSIKQLEDQIGSPLFVRTTRKVSLTPLGEIFLKDVTALLVQFDEMLMDVGDLVNHRRGKVTIACLPSIASRLLPRVMKLNETVHPGIKVIILDMNMRSITSALAAGTADLGFGSQEVDAPELEAVTIGKDHFFAILPVDSPLARRRQLHWGELVGQPFISLSHETGIRTLVDNAVAATGKFPRNVAEVTNILTLVSMVEEGIGISALPSLVIPHANQSLVRTRSIIETEPNRILRMYWRKSTGLSPAAKAIIKALISTVESDANVLHFRGVVWDLAALKRLS